MLVDGQRDHRVGMTQALRNSLRAPYSAPQTAPASALTRADPGSTCCQAKPLAEPIGREVMRFDLVLTSDDWSVTGLHAWAPNRSEPPHRRCGLRTTGVTARILIDGPD